MAGKSHEVVYKPTADKQIYSITLYIAKKAYPETALKFAERLYQFGDSLANFPNKYPICRHNKYAMRLLHCAVSEGDYIFIYKTVRSQLIVYAIIHSSRMK